MKKYLVWTIVVWVISVLLMLSQALEILPVNNWGLALIGFVILIIALKYPRQIFWLFLAVLPLENIILSASEVPISVRPFQLVGGTLMITLLVSLIFKNRKIKFKLLKPTLPSLAILRMEKVPLKDEQVYLNPVDRLVLFLGVASLIGAQFAPDIRTSLKLSLVLFSFLGFYWIARNFTRNFKHLIENIWFFLVGADAVLMLGLYQKIAEKFGWTSMQVMEKRINATFTEPNWLGAYLVFILALFLGLKYILKLLRKDKSCLGKTIQRFIEMNIGKWPILKIAQVVLNGYVFIVIAELILTVSRSAWLGAGVILTAYILIVFLKEDAVRAFRTTLFALGKIVIVIAVLNIFGLSDFHLSNRAMSSASGLQKITISCQKNIVKQPIENGAKIASVQELANYGCQHINLEEIEIEKSAGGIIKEVYRPDPSVSARKDIYKKSLVEVKKHWLFGQGLGSGGFFLGSDNLGHSLNTSNIFLEVLISMGVAGLMIFILILATPFIVGLKLLQIKSKKYANKPKEVIAVFLLLTFFAILIPNLFNAGFLIAFFWIWLAMVMSYLSME
jgi:hypothetical protein